MTDATPAIPPAIPPAIAEKFDVTDHSTEEWHIECPHCGRAWLLKKSSDPHVGNVLKLLNHASAHSPRRKSRSNP